MERIMSRVVFDNTGCWVFTGARRNGYGVIGRGRRGEGIEYVHRACFVAFRGTIPEGTEIDHLCRNRACCNPAHLRAATRSQNNLNGARSLYPSTHCRNGHEWTEENTTRSAKQRHCKQCQRDRYKNRKAGQQA
jgi:hypothetical protein